MRKILSFLFLLSPMFLGCELLDSLKGGNQSGTAGAKNEAATEVTKINGVAPMGPRDEARRVGNGVEIFRYVNDAGEPTTSSEWRVRGDGEIRFGRVERNAGYPFVKFTWSNTSKQHYAKNVEDGFASIRQELMTLYPHMLVEEAQRNPSAGGGQIDWILELQMHLQPGT